MINQTDKMYLEFLEKLQNFGILNDLKKWNEKKYHGKYIIHHCDGEILKIETDRIRKPKVEAVNK